MKRRTWCFMMAAIMIVTLALGGCGGGSTSPVDTGSDAGPTNDQNTSGPLQIWSFLNQEEMNYYQNVYQEFYPDKELKITVINGDEYITKLQNAFRSGTGCPDVMYLEIAHLGSFKETGFLTDLSAPGFGGADVLEKQYPYVQELSKNAEGEVCGISWQATPGGFWYKKSLAKQYLGTDDPEKLSELAASWDSLIQAGKAVYEKSNGKTALFSDASDIYTVLNNTKGMPWVDAQGNLVSAQLLTDNFQLLKEMRTNNADAKLDAWSAAWAEGMYQSNPFIFVGLPSWGLHYVIKANTPEADYEKAADTWGLVPAPGAYQAGGTWMAMYSKSDNQADAWNYIKTMTLDEDYLSKYLVDDLGDFPSSVPVVEAAVSQRHTDPFTGEQVTFGFFNDIAKKVKNDGITKYDSKANTAFEAIVAMLLNGDISVEQAVEQFNADMRSAFPEIN